MPRLAWCTDLHFNFLDAPDIQAFFAKVKSLGASALVLSGDTSESPTLAPHLARIRAGTGLPLLYVLGNHDFYRGSIAQTREQALRRNAGPAGETYLRGQVIHLSDEWGMVGVDGWGDGRLGSPETSPVQLNDERFIAELRSVGAHLFQQQRLRVVRMLGTEEADALQGPLTQALASFPNVLVVTHVPPFEGATWHEGAQSNADWLPWFSCKAVGDVLLAAAEANPDKKILVLCGHTHGNGVFHAAPNLEVRTGRAEYRDFFVETVEC